MAGPLLGDSVVKFRLPRITSKAQELERGEENFTLKIQADDADGVA